MPKHIGTVLLALEAAGVKFWLENGGLRFRATDEAVVSPEFEEARARKNELIEHLGRVEKSVVPPVSKAAPGISSKVSSAQAFWWWLDQEKGGMRNCFAFGGQMIGDVDVSLLGQAFQIVVERNAILRSRFRVEDAEVWQVEQDEWRDGLLETDLSFLCVDDALDRCREITKEDAQAPFDLSKGPVFKARLIKIANDRVGFVLSAHPIVIDFLSWPQIVGEALISYVSLSNSMPVPLPPPVLTYRDFAVWENTFITGPNLAENGICWRERIAEAGRYELPYKHSAISCKVEPPLTRFQQLQEKFSLAKEAHKSLRMLEQQSGIPVTTLLSASFLIFLARWTGRAHQLASYANAERPPGLEAVMGTYLTHRPIDLQVRASSTFLEFASQVRQSIAATSNLDRILDPETQMSGSLRQIVFNAAQVALPQPGGAPVAEGLQFHAFPHADKQDRETWHEIGFFFTESPVGIELLVAYAAQLFDTEEVRRAQELHVETLDFILQSPSLPLHRALEGKLPKG